MTEHPTTAIVRLSAEASKAPVSNLERIIIFFIGIFGVILLGTEGAKAAALRFDGIALIAICFGIAVAWLIILFGFGTYMVFFYGNKKPVPPRHIPFEPDYDTLFDPISFLPLGDDNK